jgi:DNA-binding MarR family transcriptional regulator
LTRQIRGFSEYLQRVGAGLFQEAFKAQGIRNLTVQQLRYLEVIEGSPGLSPGSLAERFAVTKPTVSNVLARLEHHGLIRRERDPEDGRGCFVHPTESARRIFEKRRKMYAMLAAHIAGKLGTAETRELVRLFAKVTMEEEKRT